MTIQHTTRPALRMLPLIAVAVVLSAFQPAALADPGRVHLRDGSTLQGEIVTFEPGVGVSIQIINGSVIQLGADIVARVEIGISPAPAPDLSVAPAQPAPMPNGAPAPAAFSAAAPPPRFQSRRPGLTGPLIMGGVGLLIVLTGTPIYLTSYDCYDCYEITPKGMTGLAIMGIGGALAISGLAIWLPMRIKNRRLWDGGDSVALQLAPPISRQHAGLQLNGTF